MNLTPRARVALAALTVPILALSLTGCFNGLEATTNVQATQPSGDGVSGEVGIMKINNATLVLGSADSKSATLIMTVTNVGTAQDSLIGATIAGSDATPSTGEIAVIPQSSASFGYVGAAHSINAVDFDIAAGIYVPVTLVFKTSGTLTLSVMTVSADGIYSGITPSPAG